MGRDVHDQLAVMSCVTQQGHHTVTPVLYGQQQPTDLYVCTTSPDNMLYIVHTLMCLSEQTHSSQASGLDVCTRSEERGCTLPADR